MSPGELPTPAPLIYTDGTDPHESADYKVRHKSLHLFQISQATSLAQGCTIKIIGWEELSKTIYIRVLVLIWSTKNTICVLKMRAKTKSTPEVWLSSVINRNNSQMAFWCTPTFRTKKSWYTGLIAWFPRGADARQCWHHGTEYDPKPTIALVMLLHLLLEWLF